MDSAGSPFTNNIAGASETWMSGSMASRSDVFLQIDGSNQSGGGRRDFEAESPSSSTSSSPMSTRSSLSANYEWLMAHAPRRKSFMANPGMETSTASTFWDSSAYWL
jgi:hypothetical protein